jgi:hypothetical protein
VKSGILMDALAGSILHDCGTIRRLLIASINTAKENMK